jgi:hypothetical protein
MAPLVGNGKPCLSSSIGAANTESITGSRFSKVLPIFRDPWVRETIAGDNENAAAKCALAGI